MELRISKTELKHKEFVTFPLHISMYIHRRCLYGKRQICLLLFDYLLHCRSTFCLQYLFCFANKKLLYKTFRIHFIF